jgi:hypothetical protein
MSALANSVSTDAVNCPARSRTKNRKSAVLSPRSINRLRICCVVHGPSGFAVTPRICTYREPISITKKQHRRCRVTAQSTWKKVGRKLRRGLRTQEIPPRRVGAPLGAGGTFSALRTRRIVDALTRWPTLEQLTLDLLYPQLLFSVASRPVSAATSALTGGRPILFG